MLPILPSPAPAGVWCHADNSVEHFLLLVQSMANVIASLLSLVAAITFGFNSMFSFGEVTASGREVTASGRD